VLRSSPLLVSVALDAWLTPMLVCYVDTFHSAPASAAVTKDDDCFDDDDDDDDDDDGSDVP